MAKQTFTTGQVLTAAQMTSLQQTAMLGGAASAKTASYTLVAADAGTAISMSNASATTITVNTALFAAGDTIQITNIGAGVCTITAGTATVNTSASLALAQYESGTLNFTSTSAAIFIKGAGGASGGMTLLETLTLSGASVTSSTIPGTYKELQVIVRNYRPAGVQPLRLRFNGNTTSYFSAENFDSTSASATTSGQIAVTNDSGTGASTSLCRIDIPDYANATTYKITQIYTVTVNETDATQVNTRFIGGVFASTGAITSLTLKPESGNFTSGSALIYGVN